LGTVLSLLRSLCNLVCNDFSSYSDSHQEYLVRSGGIGGGGGNGLQGKDADFRFFDGLRGCLYNGVPVVTTKRDYYIYDY
jgi:hypothetical protein